MIAIEHRRWIARLVKIGLVGVAIVVVLAWMRRKSPVREDFRIQTEAPAVAALGQGDMILYNRDSSVNVILQGDRLLAGLSEKTAGKIRQELEKSAADDSGIGGSIAQIVKKSVAGTIGIHAVYPLRDMRDIEFRDDRLVIIRNDGSTTELFGSTRVDGTRTSRTFSAEESRRFVEAVRARKRALEGR